MNGSQGENLQSHKTFNFESKILIDETISEYGYHPDKFGESSSKFILATCRFCGKPSAIRKCFFKKSGSACHKDCRLKEQSLFSPFKKQETQEKVKRVILEKYGVEYPSQNELIANKISESKRIKKYPQSYIDILKLLDSHGVDFEKRNQNIIIPHKFVISCHFNDDLIKKENAYFVREQTKVFSSENMHVFHIFEHQWPGRSFQIFNFIKSNLGLNSVNIMARKCSIDYSNQSEFIERNHIQGKPHLVQCYINLIYDNRVIASLVGSRHHRQNRGDDAIVLSRLCFADGVNLQGGSSKLFKKFVDWARINGYRRIISWSDNAWARGNVYSVLGFVLAKEYSSDYFYWDVKNRCYVSKQSQQKGKTGCPVGMTEREWCLDRGLHRIWDCGKKLWVYELKS